MSFTMSAGNRPLGIGRPYRLALAKWLAALPLAGMLLAPLPAQRQAAARSRPKTVRNALSMLRVALNWAVRHDLVQRNVAAVVKPPSVSRFESHWATPEERAGC